MLRILVLAFFAFSATAVPLAPLAPSVVQTPYDDIAPAVASDGTSTLVVWTYAFSPYFQAHSIYGRLMGRQESAFHIHNGYAPSVAWNGSEYLVGYGIGGSRFSSWPFWNAGATIVQQDGTLGVTRLLNFSPSGAVTDVAWDGDEWLVAIRDVTARVVTLNRQLEVVRTADSGKAGTIDFVEIGGQWQTLLTQNGVSELAGFSIAGSVRLAGSLAFVSRDNDLGIATFDASSGFSPVRPLLGGATLLDAVPFGNGARIVYQIGSNVREAVVDARGQIVRTTTHVTNEPYPTDAAIGEDAVYVSTGLWRDIYAFPERELVSVVRGDYQYAPLIASTGDHATTFWRQSLSDTTFMRRIDANGIPFGPVAQLPYEISADADVVFDGDRFILVWATLSGEVFLADGTSPPLLLGHGTAPAIANGRSGAFVVWRSAGNVVVGTPYPAVVPDGFAILPTGPPQGAPDIVAAEEGFLVLWPEFRGRTTLITRAGTALSSYEYDLGQATTMIATPQLAAFASSLFAYGPNGHLVQLVAPEWGAGWAPVAITDLGEGRHHVTITRDGMHYTSIVTVRDGGFLVDITPLERLGPAREINDIAIAAVQGRPVVLYTAFGSRQIEVEVRGTALRRRAARR